MGKRPSDKEFELKRQIADLKSQIHKLEDENKKLRKAAEKSAPKEEYKKPAKLVAKPCPDCGAEVKSTDMPHAVLELCAAGCGFRKVRNK